MILHIVLIVTLVKFLFIPLYHSTDFEVHRNWLAITHNLTIDKWYYDSTSEWTLDYPPFFAWLEYALSHVAKYFDPKMLEITNLNYDSEKTILFQRLSVIFLDFVYVYGVKSCSDMITNGRLLVFILLISNPGLIMVDHIHFQYNGFLYGILLISISNLIQSNFLQAALWFSILLNLKHIFLYIAPLYAVYLFRSYCFTVASNDGIHTAWYSFKIKHLIKLAAVVLSVFGISFGPFHKHIPQIMSRLFPFKRGLCHAYWAPNFWALYNFADKILQRALLKLGYPQFNTTSASMTGGLVQEFDHVVLPSITPTITFVLTLITMVPALIKMWNLCADKAYRGVNFVRCIAICASCSFIFGWHVHEKAIIMILIPMTFMSVLGHVDCAMFLVISTVGHYSLFPLLYPKELFGIKFFMLLTHCAIAFVFLPSMYDYEYDKRRRKRNPLFIQLPLLNTLESMYVYGLLWIMVYENLFHWILGFDKSFPFLPLMLTSVYCSIGVLYYFVSYYYYFLTLNLSRGPYREIRPPTSQFMAYTKKDF